MILGGYYLNYFKIYDVYTKYFKKENPEKDVLVTEEITTDLLSVSTADSQPREHKCATII